MRTPEQKIATKQRKAAVRDSHRQRVMKHHPPAVRYAKAKFKKGSKNPRRSRAIKVKIGLQ